MPYHLGKSSSCPPSKPFAVLKDDGSVAPGGCHETREKALKHQRALQVNVEDAGVDREFGEMMVGDAHAEYDDRDALIATIELGKDFSTQKRQKMAKSGSAMPDGSFPIENCTDVSNAVRAIGRTPESKRPAVKAHIKKRAKALGCTNVPDDW